MIAGFLLAESGQGQIVYIAGTLLPRPEFLGYHFCAKLLILAEGVYSSFYPSFFSRLMKAVPSSLRWERGVGQ